MTTQQIQLVKYTWATLREVDPALLGEVFFGSLFLKNPSLRRLFPPSMNAHYPKFVQMLSLLVMQLDQPADMLSELEQMARKHLDYGVKPAHYAPVGKALLWTLERGLGTDWNPDVQTAWEACYERITDVMLNEWRRK